MKKSFYNNHLKTCEYVDDTNKMKTVRFNTTLLDKPSHEDNDKAEENKDVTKAMVVDCCLQINQLKQVALESQERKRE